MRQIYNFAESSPPEMTSSATSFAAALDQHQSIPEIADSNCPSGGDCLAAFQSAGAGSERKHSGRLTLTNLVPARLELTLSS